MQWIGMPVQQISINAKESGKSASHPVVPHYGPCYPSHIVQKCESASLLGKSYCKC